VPIGRNPMLLAKELAQLDQLSGGRLLLSFVPGLGQPAERQALGIGNANRGEYLEEVIPLIRRWWAGESIDHRSHRFSFQDISVRPLPAQQPLEIWLGGIGPEALRRAGELGDGWLGAAVTPTEAGAARRRIAAAAAAAGRSVDPEHYGLSIPYARTEPDPAALTALRTRRGDGDLEDILPVGRLQLRTLVGRLVDQGLTKFVLRPLAMVPAWRDDLGWLAETLLGLES
jgi:probable F420-dependent oxidoreductase